VPASSQYESDTHHSAKIAHFLGIMLFKTAHLHFRLCFGTSVRHETRAKKIELLLTPASSAMLPCQNNTPLGVTIWLMCLCLLCTLVSAFPVASAGQYRNKCSKIAFACVAPDKSVNIADPPVRHKIETTEMSLLRQRVHTLERLVGQLCGALLYSDDMSVVERQTAEIGTVYRDGSFGEYRHPVFACKKIEDVLKSNGFIACHFHKPGKASIL